MNDLVKALVEGLIDVNESTNRKIVGMFGGGFKPPTLGHLEVVKRALEENPEMDELIILVGSGTRDTITQDDSLAIWNIYKKYLPNKVKVITSPDNKPPIGAIYSYARKNPDEIIYFFVGAREGNEGDLKDIAIRTASLRKLVYQNVKVKEIITGGAISGTKARQAVLAKDKETFLQFIPDISEADEIWDMLTDIVKERTNFSTDFITQGDVEFVDDMADRKLAPIDIDLSGNHFFDRLNDPRNFPDISIEELEEFFDKLSDEKEKFIEFLRKYKDIVVKDTESNLNIPFMKRANKAIAKTIMRKKNFMTSNQVLPLEEGRYDAEVTRISRMIINVFKDNLGKKVEDTFEEAGEINGEFYDVEVYLYPAKDFEDLGPIPFIINAAADEDGIAIQINYDVNAFPKSLNKLIPELKDAIRHELEHLSQYRFDKGVYPTGLDKQDDLPLVDYLTLDYEIPAFVQGIYKNAKTRKIPFTTAVDEFLDDRIEELTSEERSKVKQIYIDYAKKNLPAAQITEGKYDSLVTKLAGFTLNAWVDDFNDGQSQGYFELEVGPGKEFDYPFLDFNYKAKAKFGDNFNVKGVARPLKPEVELNYSIPVDELPRMWEQIAIDLRNTIRHEIEHLMQSGPNVKKGKEKSPDYREREELRTGKKPWWKIWRKTLGTPDYYKLEKEVDANLQGLYLKAKKSRTPLKQVIDNYVKYDLNLPIEDQEEVKRIWAERAPALNIPLEEGRKKKKDPKKGTGKKPKGSGRRLYTDEDPKDTVGIKFSTRQDIVNTLNKKSFKAKSHARQSQIINLIHQRVRAALSRAKDPSVKKRLNIAFEYIKKRKEASKAKTKRLQAQKKKKKANENIDPKAQKEYGGKSAPFGSAYKPVKENMSPQIISLTQYMDENGLDLKPYPKIKFINNDINNAKDIFGRTAYYDPNQQLIALYTMGRHPKDILRSYAHELVHHHQNINNTLDHGQTTNTNEDDNLDKLEREAYETGNILFRNWEDSIKN
jgi:cytidyltransferase-like protein